MLFNSLRSAFTLSVESFDPGRSANSCKDFVSTLGLLYLIMTILFIYAVTTGSSN